MKIDKKDKIDTARISNTLGKFSYYMENHNSISVGVSGGSDSNIIVHIIATYFRQYLPKTHFVFCDTGLEYDATKRHIKYMQEHYDIKIDMVNGMPIPLVIKKYGVPVLSKSFSKVANAYCRNIPYAVYRVNNAKQIKGKGHLSDTERMLIKKIKQDGILVSDKCCEMSKKKPAFVYYKKMNTDLYLSGERKDEGGNRAISNNSCYMPNVNGIDHYMPLFFWNDETKQYYKESENIVYSDCYELWGMKRTGCVGCPFNSRVAEELKMIEQYEPKLYKACINIFGKSYELMDTYCFRRKKMILQEQLDLLDV